eukprot:2600561-Pleurochrysis_carterae.AAC.1
MSTTPAHPSSRPGRLCFMCLPNLAELGRRIEAEGDHALELGVLARGDHLAGNGHVAAQPAA